jgi:TRAP transporter TAXI family solute receptor
MGAGIRLIACLSFLAALSACSDSANETGGRSNEPIVIASNPAGTHVYTVAAGLAKLLQEELERPATIRPLQGSSVYLPMLQRGDVPLGLNTSIDGYLSYRGLPPYAGAMQNLRTLGMIFPLNIMYMVRADSNLYRIEDLRDKRVVVTFRANAALEQLHRGILATGGLDLDDVNAMTVGGLTDAMTALQDGSADAVPTGLGTALTLQVDSALPDGIRYLTMGEDEARLAEIMPGTRVITVEPEAGTVGIEGPVRVSSVPDMLNTGVHMDEDLAYSITRAIHQNFASLIAELPQLTGMTPDDMAPSDNMHPYHPGAIRYYQEIGLWTDAHEANQTALLNEFQADR